MKPPPICIEGTSGDPWVVEVVVRPRNGSSGNIRTALPVDKLLDGIRTVAAGQTWKPPCVSQQKGSLTSCERNVVRLVTFGLRNAEIARQLFITEGTVKTHLNKIFRKLGLRSRTELMLHAISTDILETGEQPAADAQPAHPSDRAA